MQNYNAKVLGENKVLVSMNREMDGKRVEMTLNCSIEELAAGNAAYHKGALIQDAFPFLTADEREFLMTGITKSEWNEIFSEEAEANEEDDMKGVDV